MHVSDHSAAKIECDMTQRTCFQASGSSCERVQNEYVSKYTKSGGRGTRTKGVEMGAPRNFGVARQWRATWKEMAPACHLACQWATLTIYGSTSPKKFSRYSVFLTRVRIMSLRSMLSPLTSSYH